MEESPRAISRRAPEENLDCKAQFISMELVMKKLSNGWEESPRMRRGAQGALESQEEFAFAMSSLAARPDLYEPAMEVVPADELFFRGQLLPLEHDPRLQLLHSLSGMQRRKHIDDSSGFAYAGGEDLSMELAYAEAFPLAVSPYDVMSSFDPSAFHKGGVPLKAAVEEEGCPQARSTSSAAARCCQKSDGGMDAVKNDSRSSSFRSQHSSYWGSGEKDSRDSSSSSRCSNGSSQDGCLHGAERKAPQQSKAVSAEYCLNGKGDVIDEGEDCAGPSQAPVPSVKGKRWTWRALFNGLRKASKIWVDDRGEEQSHAAAQRDASGRRRSVFGLVTAGQASRGTEREEARRAGWQQAASRGKGIVLEEHGKKACSSKPYMGYGGHRGHSYFDGSNGGRPGRDWAKLGIIAWNARESWQRWVKKPLSGKLSGNAHRHTGSMHGTEDLLPSFNVRAKSLSSTPLVKSPARRSDNVAHTPDFYGGGSSSSKYATVGLTASCPASMRSSPHHSGVLAVVNKPPSPSSLQDLHTAIQGAIAHCKQSQGAAPPN